MKTIKSIALLALSCVGLISCDEDSKIRLEVANKQIERLKESERQLRKELEERQDAAVREDDQSGEILKLKEQLRISRAASGPAVASPSADRLILKMDMWVQICAEAGARVPLLRRAIPAGIDPYFTEEQTRSAKRFEELEKEGQLLLEEWEVQGVASPQFGSYKKAMGELLTAVATFRTQVLGFKAPFSTDGVPPEIVEAITKRAKDGQPEVFVKPHISNQLDAYRKFKAFEVDQSIPDDVRVKMILNGQRKNPGDWSGLNDYLVRQSDAYKAIETWKRDGIPGVPAEKASKYIDQATKDWPNDWPMIMSSVNDAADRGE